MNIDIETAATVCLDHVKISLSARELFEKLCFALEVDPRVITPSTGQYSVCLEEDGIHTYEDISRHGSPCWNKISVKKISEADRKLYEALQNLYDVVKENREGAWL